VLIFLSSTFIELRDHRDRAIHGISTSRHAAVAMEFFPAEAATPLNVALEHLDRADVMLLLVGFYGGSCIPGGSGSTYTEAELNRARARHMPILSFIRTQPPGRWLRLIPFFRGRRSVWKNKESNRDAREALRRIHEFATKTADVTPAYFDSPDQLEARIVEALDRWEQRGRPGARRVFATWEEIYGPSVILPLAYGHSLVGRDTELRALNEFLAGPRHVAVISGRGGIGKSKLIRDWAHTLPSDVSVLLVRDGAAWHPEAYKEVPVGRVVLFADDAHADMGVGQFLALVRELITGGRDVKAVLLTRPSGEKGIDAHVTRRFAPGDVMRLPRLAPLPKSDSRQLAEMLLRPERQAQVSYLVSLAGDTPLVLVVAADLINRGVHLPEMMREDEFRRLVLDRLLDEYRAGTSGWLDWWNQLLDLIAAVGPTATNSSFAEAASTFLAKPTDEVVRAIDVLHARGLLSQRGGIHVVPDALADHILEEAAFRPDGQPTGYVRRVFGAFGETHLTEILANAGEAEWQRSNSQGLLTSEIWANVLERIEQVRGWELRQLLTSLERSAPYFPQRVIEVVDLARQISDELNPDERAEVLRELPQLLRGLRYHLEFIEPAATRLLALAQADRRAPHSYPDHAARVLNEMAAYGRQPVVFNEEMLRVAGHLAEQPGAFDAAYTPLDIVDELLEREVELTDSDDRAVTISTRGLNYRAVAGVRTGALALADRLFNRPEPNIQIKAFKVLERLIGGSTRMLGRLPDADEQSWQDAERVAVLGILERRIDSGTTSPILLHEIKRAINHLRPSDGGMVATRIDAVSAKIPDTDDLVIVHSVCTADWDFRDANDGFHDSETRAAAARSLAVEIFTQRWPQPREQVQQLETLLRSASDYGGVEYTAGGRFATELFGNPAVLDTSIHYMLAHPDGALAQFMPFALSVLRTNRPLVYQRLAKRLVRPASRESFAHAATQVAAFNDPTVGDLVVLATALRRDSFSIRKLAIDGFGRALAIAPSDDVASAIVDALRLDPELVEVVSEALSRYLEAAPTVSRQVVQLFFERLVEIPKPDGYHVLTTIARLAVSHPELVAGFLLARLNRSATQGWRYRVVPGSVTGGIDGTALRTWPGYADFLRSVVESLGTAGINPEHVAEIFWACGGYDSTHLSLLDELAHSAAPVGGEHLVALIRKAPSPLATVNPLFACHVLETLLPHPPARRAVLGALIANATPRSWSRTLGQPAAVWVTLRDQAQHLVERYPSAADLFDALRRYADSRMAEDEAQDNPEE
jgi:hypothetical protein